jgi:hypothetical protein
VQLRGLVWRLLYKNRVRPGNAAGDSGIKNSPVYAHRQPQLRPIEGLVFGSESMATLV